MATDSSHPLTEPAAAKHEAKGAGIGLTQLLGFGLVLTSVLFLLIFLVQSLFTSA